MTPPSATTLLRAPPEARLSQASPSDTAQSADAVKSHDIERHQAIVVGAGSAGLAAAVAMQRRGFETIVIETSDAVGARWRSRYAELRLNSWRPMSKLQGRGMPRSTGRYPSRDDVVAYLEHFAREHAIELRFRTQLLGVDRDHEFWRLDTSAGPMLCRYLVIATGWDAIPVMPCWSGAETFGGDLIHASEFKSAMPYAGRDVLVVGAGNSGFDIAGHLVRAGARVTLSMRTPPNLAAREVLRLPGQPILVVFGDHVPPAMVDTLFRFVQRLTFGDLRRYGIPLSLIGVYANHRQYRRNPAVDDGFVAALKRGAARVVGTIEHFEGSDVVLADGARLRPDAVVCATGYRRGLEPLVGHLGVLGEDGVPVNHAGTPDHRCAPRLYFCGMWGPFSGQIRLGPIHARRIARAAAVDRRMRYRVFARSSGR
jgi:putative flavoprotein involved in K+ transport